MTCTLGNYGFKYQYVIEIVEELFLCICYLLNNLFIYLVRVAMIVVSSKTENLTQAQSIWPVLVRLILISGWHKKRIPMYFGAFTL